MNIKFANLDTRYKSGMDEFLKFHNIDSSKDGFNITIEITDEEIIKISKESNEIKFTLVSNIPINDRTEKININASTRFFFPIMHKIKYVAKRTKIQIPYLIPIFLKKYFVSNLYFKKQFSAQNTDPTAIAVI